MLNSSLVLNSHLSFLCVLDFGIQWLAYVISILLKTEKFYDITGSLTFIILVSIRYEQSLHTLRQTLHICMVAMWATRLGFYLLVRILKTGRDRRFNAIKENAVLFFFTWTLQGVWVFVTLLPTLVLMSKPKDDPMSDRDYVGYSLWLVGFIIEVVADYQKTIFRNNPANKGKFITTGLWSVSRHPNYLGEIMLWFGLYLSASTTFNGKEMMSVLCPIFDMVLITKFSGIPPLERYGLMRWGHDPKYIAHIKKTALLIPYFY